MNDNIAIKVNNLNKIYPIYDDKIDRMKEALSLTRKKKHKEFYALNNVSFQVKKGENIGIIGQNGSGKSTLLKILTGVLTQSEGDVNVYGKISALLELGAGFNPEMTGRENIFLNGTIMGYSKEEIEAKIPKIIRFADIGDFIEQPVKMYSSGMFARLAFAVAINVEPEILIVDEALSVGDTRFQIKCMEHMKKMMEGGTTVIFVSHDTNAMRRFCDKGIWLNKGRIMEIGDMNQVADSYTEFLKTGITQQEMAEEKSLAKTEEVQVNSGDCIGEIIDFKISNQYQTDIDVVAYDEKIAIEVVYNVYDDNIKNAVLGVALKDIEGESVCGLNTLLDGVRIPWKLGKNKVVLEYTEGIRVLGGNYQFDVALFEQTATYPIQYLAAYKALKVIADYPGQGLFIIPHSWSN